MTDGRFARALVLACAGLGLLASATARAQAGGPTGGSRPPVRATSTVEVIDVGRGVDDIISRVRAQQRRQAPPAPTPPGPKATVPSPAPAAKGAEARPHEAEELRAERPERPRPRSEREKHDLHHPDRDLGRRIQTERAREGRK